jgi:hypothetical protein
VAVVVDNYTESDHDAARRFARRVLELEDEAHARHRMEQDLRGKLMKAQTAFIHELLIYIDTNDLERFVKAQTAYLGAQMMILKRLGLA